jgi:hypothetical protein
MRASCTNGGFGRNFSAAPNVCPRSTGMAMYDSPAASPTA